MDYKVTIEGEECDGAITWARRKYNKDNLQNTKKTNEEFIAHLLQGQANQWVNERRTTDTTELAKELLSAVISGDDDALNTCISKAKDLK